MNLDFEILKTQIVVEQQYLQIDSLYFLICLRKLTTVFSLDKQLTISLVPILLKDTFINSLSSSKVFKKINLIGNLLSDG